MDNPHFTVILPTYNQNHYLKLILQAFNHHYEKYYQNFDIVVCDDGGAGALEVIRSISTPYELRYYWHRDEGFRLAKTKNAGLKMASGWVVIFDGDTLPTHSTFTGHIPNLDKDTISIGLRYRAPNSIGKMENYEEDKVESSDIKTDFRLEELSLNDLPDYGPLDSPHIVLSGVNVCFNAPTFLNAIGGNNEDIKGYGLEDLDYAVRWLAKGKKFKAANNSITYHIDHPAKPGSEQATKEYTKTLQKYLKKARENVKNLIDKSPVPVAYLR